MLPLRGKKKSTEMVKAPRSKGCRVCVQRRIKCDQTKPHCLRCQRANRECPGFETTQFVDEGPTLKAFYQGSGQGPSDASRYSSLSPRRDRNEDPYIGPSNKQQERPRKRSITPINAENWESGDFERTAMINIICPSAYQTQILSDFINAVRQPVQAPTFRCHSMWLRDVALCSNQSSCLTWAVRAISIAHLGRLTHDSNLIETSRRVYGKALLKLNAALQDPVEGLSSSTLSATMILSFYEVFNCTDRYSWIKHAGGAGHLIRLRGPARHRSGTDRTIFMACRHSLIMESFQNKTACFLDTPEWRALGWKINKDLKRESEGYYFLEANEQFFQELVAHPAYLRDAIKAVADPEPHLPHLQDLLTKGHAHRTNYQTIHGHLTDELRAQGGEPTKIPSMSNDITFPVVYEYRDIHVASLYVGYWAALCAINITLIGLQTKLAKAQQQQQKQPPFPPQQERLQPTPTGFVPSQTREPTPTFTSPSTPQFEDFNRRHKPLWDAASSYSAITSNHTHLYIAENAAYAREICKSAENLQSTPFIGPLFLVLALRMALRMGISRQEKQWVLDKLDVIGENMGIAKSEVEVYWKQRAEAGAQGKGPRTGAEGKGMCALVEKVRGRTVGSGVEMAGVGVVGFGEDDEDVNEGGLDPAGPPGVETNAREDWNRVVIDPAILGGGAGGPAIRATTPCMRADAQTPEQMGWGGPVNTGYAAGNPGLVAEMTPMGTQGGSEELGTIGGLGVEWEESAGLWRHGEGIGGLSGA